MTGKAAGEVAASKGRAAYGLTGEPPEAIVLTCSDPRFQKAFDEFTRDLGLREGTFVRLVVSGGGWVLLNAATLPGKDFQALRERIDLHCRLSPTIRRLVMVIHDDCRWYEHAVGGGRGAGSAGSEPSRETLRRGQEALGVHLAAPLEMEVYHARFKDEGRREVEFERVL